MLIKTMSTTVFVLTMTIYAAMSILIMNTTMPSMTVRPRGGQKSKKLEFELADSFFP